MQVTKHEVDVDFKPVVITIKFTTAEELSAFSQIMFHNVSIPDHLFTNNNIDVDTSKNMFKIMAQIVEVL